MISRYHGMNMTYKTVPADHDEQLKIIDHGLQLLVDTFKLYHNDVMPRNFFVKDNIITLIDFDLATVGRPSRRTKGRPVFNTCDTMRGVIKDKWRIK